MKVLIVDNYDSFTYNLYQYAGEILEAERLSGKDRKQYELHVYRNDEISIEDVNRAGYDRIILSPGPGDPSVPEYFGVCLDILKGPAKSIPLLGVCLGMQGMAYAFGGSISRARLPMHGKTSLITNDQKGIFRGLPAELEVMRYHSLIVDMDTLPDCFEITSVTAGPRQQQELMGIRHKEFTSMEGIQFHPESFATEAGLLMVRNFLTGI